MHRIRSVGWLSGGVLLSAVSVFLIGYFGIQIAGLRGGAVFGIDNQLAAVTDPGPALLQRLAVAAVAGGTIALLAFAVRRRPTKERSLFRWGFISATVIQIALSAVVSAQNPRPFSLNTPYRPWAEGWVVQGGMDSAVHLLLIVAIFLLLARQSPRR